MEIHSQFVPQFQTKDLKPLKVTWEAPSNIALVKYWGKYDPQLPANPSVSFSLSASKTITTLVAEPKHHERVTFELYLDGQAMPSFNDKIQSFLKRIAAYVPYLDYYHLQIHTHNTFPHSSGIASSASSMAALSLGIMSLEKQLFPALSDEFFFQKASFLARLGSGSACRSVKGEVVVWGKHEDVSQSSDLFGVALEGIHEAFHNVQDTILLVDKGSKEVSSTVGHNLMIGHPFAKARFEQANSHLQQMVAILKTGDWNAFIPLVEREALTLHAMMLSSSPYFILMKPNTLEIIQRIFAFRKRTNARICFTLDAGANVHVLYPESEKTIGLQFIKDELVELCQNNQYICDQLGRGANTHNKHFI
jgi:diphosphomevalonate decarboxylase